MQTFVRIPTVTLDLLNACTKMQGVRVNETLTAKLVEDISAGHDYAVIVVSVQHHRFAEVIDPLTQRVGSATVLLFNNLWTDPDEEVSALPAGQVVWGFPRAGGGFGPDGVLTGGLLKNVMISQFASRSKTGPGTAPTPREQAVRELFSGSGFGFQVQRDFRGWL
jgi:2-dehydropantoate 2-reductase